MKCLFCGCENSKVLDSRSTEETNSIRRRRECLGCGKRFTTYETIETTPILVVKNDGSRQPFDIMKIKSGIIKACEKRPVSLNQIDQVAYVRFASVYRQFQDATNFIHFLNENIDDKK